jgi:hypothetical protein
MQSVDGCENPDKSGGGCRGAAEASSAGRTFGGPGSLPQYQLRLHFFNYLA